MSENVLTIENATMQFGGVVAVDNLNLKVDKDQIVSLIGPNGAGKTTAFNVVTGVYAPTNGAVWFEGRKIIENTPHGKMKKLYKGQNASKYSHMIAPTPDKITQMGIARTFQNIRLWKSQTVFENVLIAKHCRRSANLLSATFRLNADEEKRQREECERKYICAVSCLRDCCISVLVLTGIAASCHFAYHSEQPQTGGADYIVAVLHFTFYQSLASVRIHTVQCQSVLTARDVQKHRAKRCRFHTLYQCCDLVKAPAAFYAVHRFQSNIVVSSLCQFGY